MLETKIVCTLPVKAEIDERNPNLWNVSYVRERGLPLIIATVTRLDSHRIVFHNIHPEPVLFVCETLSLNLHPSQEATFMGSCKFKISTFVDSSARMASFEVLVEEN